MLEGFGGHSREVSVSFAVMSDFITICERAARLGGQTLLDWRGRFRVREKSRSDLVTEADLASQEAIRRTILTEFPDHEFLGEEDALEADGPAAPAPVDRPRWIVDPLDGTTNYVHGLPQYCVSIALQIQRRIEAGVIYQPETDDCYVATSGGGVCLNGARLKTSEVSRLSEALVAVSFPPVVQPDAPDMAIFLDFVNRVQAIRRMGSAALNFCYVAAGQLDGYWALNTRPWDIAAGVLLVREAGGVVTAPDGGPLDVDSGRFVAAATGSLHRQLVEIIGPRLEGKNK